jgi:hypothetical protein
MLRGFAHNSSHLPHQFDTQIHFSQRHPLITLNNITTIAITSRICINPPMV